MRPKQSAIRPQRCKRGCLRSEGSVFWNDSCVGVEEVLPSDPCRRGVIEKAGDGCGCISIEKTLLKPGVLGILKLLRTCAPEASGSKAMME